jgi:tight adherence protein C
MALGLALGASLGWGLWCIVSAFPRWGSPPLASRVAPFIADISHEAFHLSTRPVAHPTAAVSTIFARLVHLLSAISDNIVGNRTDTLRRLAQSGARLSIEAFRARQVLWALGGIAAGALVDGVLAMVAVVSLAGLAVIPIASGIIGYVGAEFALRAAVKRRAARIVSELPTVFEFVSLCLAAGESITDSIRRVTRAGSGEFAGELAHLSRQVDTGVPLSTALSQLSARLQLPPVTRGIEQILGALDRGSPLAAVLQAQAQDAREDSKRELLEKAGQKEVVMLVPLVFLILPVTIMFAVFPGLLLVQAGFSL